MPREERRPRKGKETRKIPQEEEEEKAPRPYVVHRRRHTHLPPDPNLLLRVSLRMLLQGLQRRRVLLRNPTGPPLGRKHRRVPAVPCRLLLRLRLTAIVAVSLFPFCPLQRNTQQPGQLRLQERRRPVRRSKSLLAGREGRAEHSGVRVLEDGERHRRSKPEAPKQETSKQQRQQAQRTAARCRRRHRSRLRSCRSFRLPRASSAAAAAASALLATRHRPHGWPLWMRLMQSGEGSTASPKQTTGMHHSNPARQCKRRGKTRRGRGCYRMGKTDVSLLREGGVVCKERQ